jgi:hypothetical protein
MQRQQSRRQRREIAEAAEGTGTDPAVLAAGASVMLSWYYFFARGNTEMGLFTGLWPPTILAFASYFEQTRMGRQIERAMGKGGPVREAIDQMMGSR